MDPQQRVLLERGYEALHASALGKAQLQGRLVGVFVGISVNEFVALLGTIPAGQSVFAATGASLSVASGRISYNLGLHGPCASYDTACSSALICIHAGRRALQFSECSEGVAAGVNVMLSPLVCYGFAMAGMTSPHGRSHTFDNRADGYARSEACGAANMREAGDEPTMNAFGVIGGAVRQDGRSASLTAPNGRAQQDLLRGAFADAGRVPSDLTAAEAHGTGTGLGDPMEAGSLSAVMLKDRPDSAGVFAVGSSKANVGHAETAAGMTGLLRIALSLSHCMAMPNAQLRVLNPHVALVVGTKSCVLPVMPSKQSTGDLCEMPGNVSSYGFSGTISSYLVQSGKVQQVPKALDEAVLKFKRRSFAWKDDPHPFIIDPIPTSEESIFRSPVSGALRTIVTDHVVQGRIVFPGAGYLEMGHAAGAAVYGSSSVTLQGVFFLYAMVVEDVADSIAIEMITWPSKLAGAEPALAYGSRQLPSATRTTRSSADSAAAHAVAASGLAATAMIERLPMVLIA